MKLCGTELADALAGDALDRILLFADVLQVDRAHNVDAVRADLFDILPAMRVAAAGRIVFRQFVDQADLRSASENRVDIRAFPRRRCGAAESLRTRG